MLAGGAIHEDLGRLEVIFRNTVSDALRGYVAARGWPGAWYEQDRLFAGQQNQKTRDAIFDARGRARGYTKRRPEAYGKVIAELNFGFWRYLCHKRHLTSLWVPAIASVFALHPAARDASRIRSDVEFRMEKLHFTRNRIAHHEPIHRRDLVREYRYVLEIAGWICADSQEWIRNTSRTAGVLSARP